MIESMMEEGHAPDLGDAERIREARSKAEAASAAAKTACLAAVTGGMKAELLSRDMSDSVADFYRFGGAKMKVFKKAVKAGKAAMDAAKAAFGIFEGGGRAAGLAWQALGGARVAHWAASSATVGAASRPGWWVALNAAQTAGFLAREVDKAVNSPWEDEPGGEALPLAKEAEMELKAAVRAAMEASRAFQNALRCARDTSSLAPKDGG